MASGSRYGGRANGRSNGRGRGRAETGRPAARRGSPRSGRGASGHRRLPPSLAKGRRRGKSNPLPLALRLAIITGCLFVGLIIAVVGVTAAGFYAGWGSVTKNLPSVAHVDQLPFQTTKIYDRNWKLLNEVSDPNNGWRTTVSYGEIVGHIKQQQTDPNKAHQAWIFDATVAAEDSTFWTNAGVDPTAILRSLVGNVTGSSFSGASTITQQLVRRLYPTKIGDKETYTRKLREAITAYRFTQHYTKEQIMEMYLNNIYYGFRAYGIDAASQTYFSKHPWNLTLGEAAMLAGIPQAPSLYDPSENYDLAKARQKYVLSQMVKLNMITQPEADSAYAEPLNLQLQNNPHGVDLAPHFVNYVRAYIEQKFGAEALYSGGLIVHTTLDYNLNQQAQQIVTQQVASLAQYHVDNGALVAIQPWSGEILAMIGSADYYNDAIDGQVNVTLQERSPGSSIKPVTYLTAFEQGWNPGTVILDYDKSWPLPGQPGKFYTPQNDTLQNFGAISVRDALDNSLNIPAVQTLDYVGVQAMIDNAHKLGIRTGLWGGYYGLSVTLGSGAVTPLEHTNVFATFANEGKYVPYTPILEIKDSTGRVLEKLDTQSVLQDAKQVAPAGNVYQLTDVLTDNYARAMIFGTNSELYVPELNRPVAAKTGTSEDFRDGWTMGYTTDLAVGVWVGNTDNSPTDGLDGIQTAGPIWHDFMVAAHQSQYAKMLDGPDGKPLPKDFPVPSDVYRGPVCTATGNLPIPGAATTTEVLVKGGGPTLPCNQITEKHLADLKTALLAAPRDSAMTASGRERLYEYAAMVGYAPAEEKPSPASTEEVAPEYVPPVEATSTAQPTVTATATSTTTSGQPGTQPTATSTVTTAPTTVPTSAATSPAAPTSTTTTGQPPPTAPAKPVPTATSQAP